MPGKKMNIRLYLIVFVLLLAACGQQKPAGTTTKPPDYKLYNELLQKYVNEEGYVDYGGLLEEKSKLERFLTELSYHPPADNWSRKEKLAYWINAYNAFTLKLILDNYPLEGIKDIGPVLQIPYVNSVFDIRFININGVNLDLNFIEHQVLRKEFNEPRIHFAINCASVSCPPLRRGAYVAEKLDEQLQDQAVRFVTGPQNEISKERMLLSKIFKWFSGDFTTKGSLTDFIQQYTQVPIDENTSIFFKEYNWNLNEQ